MVSLKIALELLKNGVMVCCELRSHYTGNMKIPLSARLLCLIAQKVVRWKTQK